MQRFTKIFSIALILLSALPFTASADATPVPIHLTVVSSEEVLFDGDISVRECFDTETGTTTSVSALCAIKQTASTSGWTTNLIWYSFGPFLDAINSYQSDFANNRSWSYYTDGASGLTSIAAHILHPGEKLLFTYGVSPLRIVVASSSPKVGTTTLLQAQYYDSASSFDWVNATETDFIIDGIATTSDSTGLLRYSPTSNSLVSITAQKTGFVSSAPVVLSPYTVASTRIHLRIETNDQTIYDADISVEACADNQAGTSLSINGLCALEQATAEKGLTLGLVWYSFGPFVDSIGMYASDNTNYIYWGYYIDREVASVGASAHILTSGEELLFTYNINPLRIITTTNSPPVRTPLVLSGQFFDSTFYVWATATSATFTVNGIATTSDENGELTLTPNDTNPISVTLSRAGFIASRPLIFTPVEQSTPPSSQGGSATPDTPHTIDTQKAVSFLRALQNPDGSFGAALYTDWVAIGLSGVNGADDIRAKLVTHVKTNANPGSLLTDLERRTMALEALGIDPSVGTSRDYIREMLTHFDGAQWGDSAFINDDIFALVPLLHAGYTTNDELIKNTVATIISAQESNGSWGSIDLTAAGIQALAPVSTLPGVSDTISKAKFFLRGAQENDGGFGSSFASSWVLQAIAAISGENIATNWTNNGKTPQDYLWLLQQSDGGVESMNLDQNSRIWATAYAIPAANGKDWNSLLGSYPRTAIAPVSVFGTASEKNIGEVLGATTTATTTAIFASSTITVGTSTAAISISASSTVIIATSSTLVLASTTPVKKPFIVKKIVVKEAKASTSASVNTIATSSTAVLQSTAVSSSSWSDAVFKPFIRLYQAIHSWFD